MTATKEQRDAAEARITELEQRVAELEFALRKITTGAFGVYDHESGCAFEKFTCNIAYKVLNGRRT